MSFWHSSAENNSTLWLCGLEKLKPVISYQRRVKEEKLLITLICRWWNQFHRQQPRLKSTCWSFAFSLFGFGLVNVQRQNVLQRWKDVPPQGLGRARKKAPFTQTALVGCVSFPHTFTVLQFLHSCFSFCLLPAFPSFQCLYNMSPQCSSVCPIRHGFSKRSQGYKGLWPAHLHKSHGPFLWAASSLVSSL